MCLKNFIFLFLGLALFACGGEDVAPQINGTSIGGDGYYDDLAETARADVKLALSLVILRKNLNRLCSAAKCDRSKRSCRRVAEMPQARADLAKSLIPEIASDLKRKVEVIRLNIENDIGEASDGDSSGWVDDAKPDEAFLYSGALEERGFEALTHETAHWTKIRGKLRKDSEDLSGVNVKVAYNDFSDCLRVYFDDEVGAPGTRDRTFSTTSTVTAKAQLSSNARRAISRMVTQPDGKILVAGRENEGTQARLFVSRYLPNGEPDATFSGGKIYLPHNGIISGWAGCRGLMVQSTGRIVVTCNVTPDDGYARTRFYGLKNDGTLDTTFASGGSGYLFYPLGGGSAQNINLSSALFSDDSILVNIYLWDAVSGAKRAILFKLKANGASDTNFGSWNGYFASRAVDAGESMPASQVLYHRGRYFCVGSIHEDPMQAGLAVVDTEMRPDTGFGTNGLSRIVNDTRTLGADVVIGSDGRIFVLSAGTDAASSYWDAYIRAFHSDGRIDQSFGDSGTVKLSFHAGVSTNSHQLLLQPDGKLLIPALLLRSGNHGLGIFRLLPDGKFDRGFGNEGKMLMDLDLKLQTWTSKVALQPDGKLVLGATVTDGTAEDIALFRLHNDRSFLLTNQ